MDKLKHNNVNNGKGGSINNNAAGIKSHSLKLDETDKNKKVATALQPSTFSGRVLNQGVTSLGSTTKAQQQEDLLFIE